MKLAALATFTILLALQAISNALVVLPAALLLFCFIRYDIAARQFKFGELISANWLLLSFILIVSIGALRSNSVLASDSAAYYAVYIVIFFSLFTGGVIYFYLKRDYDITKVLINVVLLPYFMFAVINFIFYFLQVRFSAIAYETDTPDAVILASLTGIKASRAVFPFVAGINSYSVYIGAALSIASSLFFYCKKRRIITGAASFVLFLTLIFTDSRGAMLYPTLILFGLYIIKRRKRFPGIIRHFTWLIVLGPLIITAFVPLLAQSSLLMSLSHKQNSNDLEENLRFFIWAVSTDEFASFKPIHLIGWGQYGHFGSGVSQAWAANSKRYENAALSLSPHNTMFSILFDYGYLGLVVYISLIWQLFKRIRYIWAKNRTVTYPLLAFLLYNILAGMSESLGEVVLINYMLLFIMVATFISLLYYFYEKEDTILAAKEKELQQKEKVLAPIKPVKEPAF